MTKNIFKDYMPHGLIGHSKYGWAFFNRELDPINSNKFELSRFQKCTNINAQLFDELLALGCQRINRHGIQGLDTNENFIVIYFYNDQNVPINNFPDKELNKERWNRYSEVLRLVCTAMNV